jgi:tetratricopeptide (TPR) repeat protein/predicted Ser/Thr protein kinase/ribosomal protein L40E
MLRFGLSPTGSLHGRNRAFAGTVAEMESSLHAWTSICPRCGAPNPEQADFCMACAHALTGRPPAPALVRSDGRQVVASARAAAGKTTEASRRPASAAASATATPPPIPADVTVMLPGAAPGAPDDATGAFAPPATTPQESRTGAVTPLGMPPEEAITGAFVLPAPPGRPRAAPPLDDHTVMLPAGASPAAFDDGTVMLPAGAPPGLGHQPPDDDRTVLLPPVSPPGLGPHPPDDDRTVMLPAGGTPPGFDDRTVMLPPGATPAYGPQATGDDRTVMLPTGASRVTPAVATPARGMTSRATPLRGGPGRAATPFASRMSVLSSLADVDAPTLLTEGLEIADRYRVKGLIGKGGMGVVYLVDDLELEREIALKVIRSDISSSPESLERFKREIQLSAKVTHRNVLRVYDLGESEGVKFLTMEYVQGEDLSNIVKRDGRLPFDRVMNYFQQICAGLGVAHEQGVIHRDLKPQNVMIDPTDRVLLTDFGLATVAESSSAAKSGAIMGTPYYMSPEQVRGEELDQRSDIYALGIMLYELLTGAIPFAGGGIMDVMKRRLTEKPRPIGELNPDLPQYVRRIIDKCLATDRDERYASCEEIVKDIYDATEGKRRRRQTTAIVSLAAFLVIGAVGASSWYVYQQKQEAAAKQREPVTVLIADFLNTTGDATFTGTLEPMMKLALEGAGFISAYDRAGIKRNLDVLPPENLDERAATELAVKQGLGVVLSGSVERQGDRYNVTVKATQAVTGKVVASASDRTSSKNEVLPLATRLITPVRKALGDRTSDSAQRFAMETLSATSLDAVREYAAGMEALSRSRFEDALQGFSKAVALDPKFGVAYAALGMTSKNLDRQEDAEKHIQEAIRHIDGMTERERYRTRGIYYYITNDYQPCVKEYSDLIARYSADASARNNLALCLSKLRVMPKAVEEMRQAVKILPNRALYRENLATYAAYSTDFQTAEQQVQALQEPLSMFGLLPHAFAQLGQGLVAEASSTYDAIGKIDEQGASYRMSGLADIAILEGRYSDAVGILTEGAATDLAAKETGLAATKLAILAYVQSLRQQKTAASAAASKALATSQSDKIRFLAGRVFAELGLADKAAPLSAALASQLQAEPQAYALIIDGVTALKGGNVRGAIKKFTDANTLLDTWIGHFDLGRAYLEAGVFLQADSEFDRCFKRRGEALALFLDEQPTYGYFPPVLYYHGLVRDGLKSAKAAESYRAYLELRGKSTEDPLLPVVRNRAAAAAALGHSE